MDKDIEMPELVPENVMHYDPEDGDVVMVTLPEATTRMPNEMVQRYTQNVSAAFEKALDGKDVRIIVLPFGMKVEMIPTTMFKDKDE